ncbi:hypothetical protein [Dokdonella fugitiva]|uniref:hypothetical protein n=1 Tax=Dokdonella fugitiva TaxID=328517 RepID=UPI0015FD4015|nr:hypothetical protein [Dokdonella fugitiva]MBA8884917.1 hypothetical protein [Dokdonella fugitiva]
MTDVVFKRLVTAAWRESCGAGVQVKLLQYQSARWLKYMLKDRDKNDLLDAVDFNNLSLRKITSSLKPASFEDTQCSAPSLGP